MISCHQQTTTFEWFRAYTALSRSGCVTEAIRACEEAWGSEFDGNRAAVDQIRRLPEYPGYAKSLRDSLRFPLTLYRVTTTEFYERWRAGSFYRPVAASMSLELAMIVRDVHPDRSEGLVLVTGALRQADAIIMRGRIETYELVVDSACVSPVEVRVLEP